jgi:hypothetical protein
MRILFRPILFSMCLRLGVLLLCPVATTGFATTWFVATNGLDTNPGSSNSPFATIMRAQMAASANDTVYLRGGTYHLDNSNLTATNNPWAIVNNITKSGISYLAYPGELPVFNFTQVQPAGLRVTAFHVTASRCVFQGFDVVGVQVTIATDHTQSECFRIDGGNNNRFEKLRMHDGMANGWYLTKGASNLVLNCDAFNNRGLDSGSIGNTDGFGCHPSSGGRSNVIYGCRAWFNSDDGYDCINAFETVRFDHCWAFYNGYWTNFTSTGGDANGFKAGGYGVSGTAFPTPVPRHVVQFNVAVRNRANGFYSNHHMNGSDWFNNTSYSNNVNFDMLCNTNNTSTTFDVPGFNHVMKNNLGYRGRSTEVSDLGSATTNDITYNYFTLPVTVAANDFLSLDLSLLTAPRQTDGSLPNLNLLRLTNTSDCIDAGTNRGFAFYGTAPDLGAFEVGPTNGPSLAIASTGTDLILTAGGWANRTNYLFTSTNLSLPFEQWTRIGTNKSDAAGNAVFTNAITAVGANGYYIIGLP